MRKANSSSTSAASYKFHILQYTVLYTYIWAYFKSTFLLLRDISLAFLVSSIGFSTYFDMKNDVYGPIDGRTLEKDRTEKSLTV